MSTRTSSDRTSAALEKHACPACGAQAEWNPGKQKLVCPFCGTESPYDDRHGHRQDRRRSTSSRRCGSSRRNSAAGRPRRRSVQCQSCKAVMVFDPARVGQNCEFCGSPALVDYQEIKSPISPQSLLPFKIAQSEVRDSIRRWYASKWFAPSALKTRGAGRQVQEPLHPLLDVRRAGPLPVGGRGRPLLLRQRGVPRQPGPHAGHARCASRAGSTPRARSTTSSTTSPCPGTQGVPHGPAEGRSSRSRRRNWCPTTPRYLSGHVVEHYQVVLVDAAKQSREAMHAKLEQLCAEQVPGDTHRNLRISPSTRGRRSSTSSCRSGCCLTRPGPEDFQVVANGYTGLMAGRYPKSFWKVLAVTLLAIVAALLILWASGSGWIPRKAPRLCKRLQADQAQDVDAFGKIGVHDAGRAPGASGNAVSRPHRGGAAPGRRQGLRGCRPR